jgi:hypothetical protein
LGWNIDIIIKKGVKMIKFEFKEVKELKKNSDKFQANYSDGCSGSRSDCCTRVCTKNDYNYQDNLNEWDKYLEVESGVIQY